jgi:hypothetical protein
MEGGGQAGLARRCGLSRLIGKTTRKRLHSHRSRNKQRSLAGSSLTVGMIGFDSKFEYLTQAHKAVAAHCFKLFCFLPAGASARSPAVCRTQSA